MEARLFPEGEIPEYTQPNWYSDRPHAPHLEEGAHRGRLEIAARFINELQPESVVDLGCGDGGLLTLIDPTIPSWGYDLQPSNVQVGIVDRGVNVRLGNILEDELQWGELAICCEVIEHLVDPRSFVRKIAEHSKYIVASSPYTETIDDHYEYHAWCWNIRGYKAMLEENGFKVLRTETWSMFQVHLAEAI